MARPTRALVDLDALAHNCRLAARLSGNGALMAVVKANAYGHGAVEAARVFESTADALAVACAEEALALRDAGIRSPILLMEGIFSEDELQAASRHDFWVMLQNDAQLECIEQSLLPRPVCCWLKLDTGMHRLGFDPERAAVLYRRLQACPQVGGEIVLATHLACADAPGNPHTQDQIIRFRSCTRDLNAPCSIANSPGLLAWPDSRGEWNRPGVMLYGQSPFAQPTNEDHALRPAMTLVSSVHALRDVPVGDSVGYGSSWVARRPSRIATVPVGYGDGYPRGARSGTPVLVNGERAPLAGRVSMDMITVDVTDLTAVQLGDPVTLWGAGLSVNEIADWADTISYEITTRLLPRVPREYISGPAA
ncbi:MAG: alanine racemase [Halieaceae bacterium]|jgi:alanine racemase|nr:alanine racemase [Halieaceae bacterium]